MADYRELLRRAISALPENNGAARRAVYEKARTALVGQLRAITPPLPAREITQHRLQLEDCIREVEQEASEAVIKLGRAQQPSMRRLDTTPIAPVRSAPPPPPPPAEEARAPEPEPPAEAEPVADVEPGPAPQPAEPDVVAVKGESIEDIIAAAEADAEVEEPEAPAEPETEPSPDTKVVELPEARRAPEPEPSVAEPEEPLKAEESVKAEEPPPPPGRPGLRLFTSNRKVEPAPEPAPRAPVIETRSEPFRIAAVAGDSPASGGRVEATMGGQAAVRKPVPNFEPLVVVEDQPVEAALSSVREVEVEAADDGDSAETREAEGAIERAIETLDRAARGEALPEPEQAAAESAPVAEKRHEPRELAADAEDADFEPAAEGRAGSGLTIFLVVFALLLAAAGGGGYWAWREGYIDLDQMFGRATATAQTQPAETAAPESDTQTADADPAQPAQELTGPGNTSTETASNEPATALEGIVNEDRLEPTPEPDVAAADEGQAAGDPLSDERLPSSSGEVALADDPSTSVDPAVLAGSQSLLLEASDDGRTGAVPFSGTVEWTRGVDEVGMPTLVATADIPARNLGVEVTIRRNADPSLPASHLMEIDFEVADSFVGGGISSLPGVLLKNEELVQGTPLVGASARVVGNSFLFALSASEQDAVTNRSLLGSRKWMDLAVIYATGKRAIITLEKDDEAESLFNEVLAEWDEAAN